MFSRSCYECTNFCYITNYLLASQSIQSWYSKNTLKQAIPAQSIFPMPPALPIIMAPPKPLPRVCWPGFAARGPLTGSMYCALFCDGNPLMSRRRRQLVDLICPLWNFHCIFCWICSMESKPFFQNKNETIFIILLHFYLYCILMNFVFAIHKIFDALRCICKTESNLI